MDPTARSEVVVGIDLGTPNSLVAIGDERGPRVIPDDQGRALLPSVVRYEAGRTVIGHQARQAAVDFPRQTISSVKRLMGRSLQDAAPDLKYLAYEVVAGERGTARVRVPVGDKGQLLVSPEEVSAQILRTLKQQASAALGREVAKAVVTVPAYFDDAQRQAPRTAGRLAGLDVVRLVPEPTAAALAYGLGLRRPGVKQEPGAVAVYDLGGGTFDISVLRLTPAEGDGGMSFFEVLSTAGDTHLGGDDIDHLLVEEMRRGIGGVLGADPSTLDLPPETRRALVGLAEAVKIRLSDREAAPVRLDLGAGRAFERTFTRAELEAMIAPLVERTIASCRRALRDAERALAGAPISAVV